MGLKVNLDEFFRESSEIGSEAYLWREIKNVTTKPI